MSVTLHRGYLAGCIGRVAELHALHYARTAGFGVAFEAKVARELGEFCERYDAARDGLWLARDGERIVGSIALDALHADSEGAHLRWFLAADEVRGSGLGTALLRGALEHGDRLGYRRYFLWTFDGLHAARHLYEKMGFRLAEQRRGMQWGTVVDEQRFERHAADAPS